MTSSQAIPSPLLSAAAGSGLPADTAVKGAGQYSVSLARLRSVGVAEGLVGMSEQAARPKAMASATNRARMEGSYRLLNLRRLGLRTSQPKTAAS